jgi:hypothetical protein
MRPNLTAAPVKKRNEAEIRQQLADTQAMIVISHRTDQGDRASAHDMVSLRRMEGRLIQELDDAT